LRNFIGALLLAPALALLPAAAFPTANARYLGDPLLGTYVNATNGRVCTVAPGFSGYVFTNENGDQAAFSYYSPRSLAITSTPSWDPSTVATVIRDRFGRISIRFTSPGSAPGVWVRSP